MLLKGMILLACGPLPTYTSVCACALTLLLFKQLLLLATIVISGLRFMLGYNVHTITQNYLPFRNNHKIAPLLPLSVDPYPLASGIPSTSVAIAVLWYVSLMICMVLRQTTRSTDVNTGDYYISIIIFFYPYLYLYPYLYPYINF